MDNNSSMEQIKSVVMDLLGEEKRKLAWQILDIYFEKARTLADYDTLGFLALKAENRPMYLACAEAAYALTTTPEQMFIARSNLYKAYNALNQPEKALFYIEQNLKIKPDDFETLTQRAFNLALAGQRKESEDLLLKLVEQHPERAKDMQSALSGKMLRDGKTAQGILNFIDTFKPKSKLFDEVLRMRKWYGAVMPGKTIYIEGEGGIGDELINIRFFDWIKERGMTPILYSAWSKYRIDTVDLFRRHGYQVITESYSINPKELWTSLMSLPGYLNLNEQTLWRKPYLFPLKQEKNKLNSNKFKIGIKCQGNPYFSQDAYRCIPLDKMLEYLPESAEIYYIDKEEKSHDRCIDLSSRIDTWEDTLDFIDQMDCIVSSCTSLVHAAGAMGKTTFVAVPIAEYYIWSSTRTDNTSPWYGDHLRVYKQTKIRSWDEPLFNIGQQVKKLMGEK